MKKERKLKTIFLALSLLLVSATSLQASTGVSNEEISKVVKNRISYPTGLKPAHDKALVLVSFAVEPCGTVRILEANASDETFKLYVLQKIKSMRFNPRENQEIVNLKFTFQRQQ